MVSFVEDPNQMTIPHLFRCPISLDIFTDPVTLSTGQTYDRPSIEKWLSDGNLTCPVTMQKLQDVSMVPNHTLRHLINQWLLMGTQVLKPGSTTGAEIISLSSLKTKLGTPEETSNTPSTLAVRLQTLEKIRALSEDSDSSRASLIEHSFYPLLVEFLFGDTFIGGAELSPENALLVEEALKCILNLSICTKRGSLNMLKERPKLAALCNLFSRGDIKIKTSLCYLIEEISSSPETQEVASIIGQTPSILQGLVSLLEQTSIHPKASDAAVRAISGLCGSDSNRESIVREGAIHGLIMYLSNSEGSSVSTALFSLELLLGQETGKQALLSNPSAARVLVKMVFRRSDPKGSESAVGSLLIISFDSLKFRQEIIRAGVVTQLLLLLQSQCSERAKTQARILLKLLRSMWVEDPRTSNFEYGLYDS